MLERRDLILTAQTFGTACLSRNGSAGSVVDACDSRALGETRNRGMFAFFSNRLGCLGSLAVSIAVSLLLYFVLRG